MSQNQSQTVMGIMNQMDGVNLHEKKGGKFMFRMHMTQSMSESSIETLDLSVISYPESRIMATKNSVASLRAFPKTSYHAL